MGLMSLLLGGCIGPWATKSAEQVMEERMMTNEKAVEQNVKEFTITATDYVYDTTQMTVNRGDVVRIVFINSVGNHDFNLDEFGVKTNILNPGESETVEFVAGTVGSFEYYCSVNNHRQ